MDIETGEVFERIELPEGASYPMVNPKTGKKTLYRPEPCYWGKDGKPKDKPTWVLLNGVKKLPGPTICPDCGRTVVPHNPAPPPSAYQQASGK